MKGPPDVRTARGALAAERDVLDRVESLFDETDPMAGLDRPVRILVPSTSLRRHVAAALVRRRPAWLGVEVQTLSGAARSVVSQDGPWRDAEALLPVLVRRAAREEAILLEELAPLEDGEGAIVGVVRDLLDAGFEPPHADAVDEQLAEGEGRPAARARALVRVALRVQQHAERSGWRTRASLLVRAREILEAEGEAALPSRAVLIHGLADATGVVAEWVGALVRELSAELWLPGPDDPAFPGDRVPIAPGWEFTERLRGRLGVPEPPREERPADPPEIRLQRAAGAAAEVRGIAEQIRISLDAGTPPERIGVVARDLAGYRLALSSQLGRLGIPFSAGRGFPTRATRRIRALLDLLGRGKHATADLWLDAADPFGGSRLADLRLGLHSLGLGRLADVPRLQREGAGVEPRGLPLPSVRGLPEEEEGSEDESQDAETAAAGQALQAAEAGQVGEALQAAEAEQVGEALPRRRSPGRPQRRRVSSETLAWAAESAVATLRWLEERPKQATFATHRSQIQRLVEGPLGWRGETAGRDLFEAALARLEVDIEPEFLLSAEEVGLLLSRELDGAGDDSLGGAGAGVQVMGAMEARGRTFDELHLIGLNRDVFPRPIVDDPLLPDRLRRGLESLLPEIPIKLRGFAEERHLFAWLCSAAPRITLSWQEVNDDGKERPRSPLVDRIVLARPALPEREALPPWVAASPLRPGFEHVIRAGLAGAHAAYSGLLEALLPPPEARARTAVLDEQEARGDRWGLPGPYLGFVGPEPGRARDVFVTRLENLAYCPWRHFLERELGLEPVPDALAALPDVSPLLVGNVVHAVMEQIVGAAGAPVGVNIDAALATAPTDVPWPEAAQLDALLHGAAREAARREGILLPAFASFLARRARPFLESIVSLEGAGGGLPAVVGAELEAELRVRGADDEEALLRFRADRVDSVDGRLRLVDYKTGRPVSDAAQEKKRREHLLSALRAGKRLQVAAYAALPHPPGEVDGRFLFVRPGIEPAHAQVDVAQGDEEARDAFLEATATLLRGLASGTFPPRLLAGNLAEENAACESCLLSEACVRGDTGARRRHREWLVGAGGSATIQRARDVIALQGRKA